MVNCLCELFKGKINIIQDCLVLDCRKSSSLEMRKLKEFLRDMKQKFQQVIIIKPTFIESICLLIQISMFQSTPLYPCLCEPVMSKLLPALRKKHEDPFMEKAALMERIEQEACPGQDTTVVAKVVEFLNDSGAVRQPATD